MTQRNMAIEERLRQGWEKTFNESSFSKLTFSWQMVKGNYVQMNTNETIKKVHNNL